MSRGVKIFLVITGILSAPVLISPMPEFDSPLSTVVEARDGSLLGARIAADGQWRFPSAKSVPEKFEKALLTFEDRWFYYHPGINPISVFRALHGNIRAGMIVSGGSTISMQVSRMAEGNTERTYGAKITEMLSALKLEIFRSKKTILQLYSDNAPFGGNTVGLEAASWRYLGKSPADLTWSEAAVLAILPNSPSLVFPGKNYEILKMRRDQLLKKLFERKYIDSLTLLLSTDEPLPLKPGALPSMAPHLTDFFFLENKGERVRTTIDPVLQARAASIMYRHQKELSSNFIFNSACIIVGVDDGNVLAYVGNSNSENSSSDHGQNVDVIKSLRSTGSILKPILYAGMMNSGEILPNTLIADIPTRFTGFSPKNFDRSYNGAVPAGAALSQSLNIPAVKMLQKFTPERFLDLLRRTGFTTFKKPADYYGLSLILGGGESSLWELTGVYSSLSRVLKRYNKVKNYSPDDYHLPILLHNDKPRKETITREPPLSASSIWLTYEALRKVNRPETESGWQYFNSSLNIAWKTGTSFGFRDAWAIGTTPEYVIGVWAGNVDGEGRPGLTGVSAAAPVMFELAGLLNSQYWFETPYDDMTMIRTCRQSGFRAGPDCPETVGVPACINGLRSDVCPFHTIVHLNRSGSFRVTADCAPQTEITDVPWFVLPPAMEYFYRKKHPEYRSLPPVAPGCGSSKKIDVMEFIYPTNGIKIFIPRDQTGLMTHVVAELAHRDPLKKIFWHVDENYTGSTVSIHQMDIQAGPGQHILTAVDEDGNSVSCSFTITGQPGS